MKELSTGIGINWLYVSFLMSSVCRDGSKQFRSKMDFAFLVRKRNEDIQ